MQKPPRERAPEVTPTTGASAQERPPAPAQTSAPAPEPPQRAAASKAVAGPQGMVRCRAIQTCAVRGMPKYEGEEFWLEPEGAKRLQGKGHLRIL